MAAGRVPFLENSDLPEQSDLFDHEIKNPVSSPLLVIMAIVVFVIKGVRKHTPM